jgi:hypothetical protein
MESIGSLANKRPLKRPQKNRYLHSPAHLLADELSQKFNDPKHFGFYLKMAVTFPPDYLRKLASEVLEQHNVKTPAKLFAFLIKKRNEENRAK